MNQAEALLNPNDYNEISAKISNMLLSKEKEAKGDWGVSIFELFVNTKTRTIG